MWSAVLPQPTWTPTQVLFSHNTIKNGTASLNYCNPNNKGRGNQLQLFHQKSTLSVRCSINQGAAGENLPQNQQLEANSAEMSSKLAKLGLAAVLAYGLFDGVTYTSFFVLAFLGYEKSTGKNPAANLQALLGIVILMWTGNNITRPFRVAGAAALAPLIDRVEEDPKLFQFSKSCLCICACCFCSGCIMFNSSWLAYPLKMGKMG